MFEHTLEYNHELGRLEVIDYNGNVISYRDITYEEAQKVMEDLYRVDEEINMLEDTYGY